MMLDGSASSERTASEFPARFQIIRHLGSGAMGAVYPQAFDRERGRHVALKTVRSSQPADALLQLKNEFRSLQDLRHHNLVHLFELVEADGRFFVSMELVEGASFLAHARPGAAEASVSGLSETRALRAMNSTTCEPQSLLDSAGVGGELVEARLRAALGQLAEGLCALHDYGKVHRDIKPSNVLVTTSGRVVIVDFGLARDLSGAAVDGGRAGTRAFMAPEQAAGQALTSAADWYSVGVMLYLALTGSFAISGALWVPNAKNSLRGSRWPGWSSPTRSAISCNWRSICSILIRRGAPTRVRCSVGSDCRSAWRRLPPRRHFSVE